MKNIQALTINFNTVKKVNVKIAFLKTLLRETGRAR